MAGPGQAGSWFGGLARHGIIVYREGVIQPCARTDLDLAPEMSPARGFRVLDSILVADRAIWSAMPAGALAAAARRDATMLWLADRHPVEWTRGGRRVTCPPGGAILLDLADGAGGDAGFADGIGLILRDRLAPTLLMGHAGALVLQPSTVLRALRHMAGAWLASDARLSAGQTRLAGRAIGELVAAALLPLTVPGVGDRRKTSLLDRVIAHIDAHFVEELDAPAVCKALHCSRSALYRATRPAGGVVALVRQRRLGAIYDRLCDPTERIGVGELARINGFDDPTQFSRSFKRRYGRTARAVREATQAASPDC